MDETPPRPPLRLYGEHGVLPLRSPCPAGCKFCYETHLSKLVPNVTLTRTPKYTADSFALFADGLATAVGPAMPVSPIYVENGTFHYSSMSDIFCQGLDRDQLERLVRHNVGREPLDLYTAGNHLDPGIAAYLTDRYPDTFRLHLSLITFSAELRRRLFTHRASPETLLRLLRVLRSPQVYLCNFGPEQTLEDLHLIDAHAREGARVQLARLHCTSMHSEDIRALAGQSGSGFYEVAEWLVEHRATLGHIQEIHFQAPPEAYAWTFRDRLRETIEPLGLGAGDVVLCSSAARETLERHVVPDDAAVCPVQDSLGATTSFTTTISTENVIEAIRCLQDEGRRIKRVVLPGSMYWIQDRYSVDGRSPDDVRRAFPEIEVALVPVPMDVRMARLSAEEVLAHVRANPAARTRGDYPRCRETSLRRGEEGRARMEGVPDELPT